MIIKNGKGERARKEQVSFLRMVVKEFYHGANNNVEEVIQDTLGVDEKEAAKILDIMSKEYINRLVGAKAARRKVRNSILAGVKDACYESVKKYNMDNWYKFSFVTDIMSENAYIHAYLTYS